MGVASVLDKIDVKIKSIIRDRKGHCIMIKGSIYEEDTTTFNIYESKSGASQYIRQMLQQLNGNSTITQK